MSLNLKIVSITFLMLIILISLRFVRKDKMNIKYSFIWTIPCFILLLFILIPSFMVWVTNLFGFQTASNMIIFSLLGILIIINICLTVIVSKQKDDIRTLIQEISILKKDKGNEKR